MKAQLIREAKMSAEEKHALRRNFDQYYQTVTDYTAFAAVSQLGECWVHIKDNIRERLKENQEQTIRILEIGAGRSGFGEWLKREGLRDKVQYWVQDVTSRNAASLKPQADHMIYGDVSEISKKNYFDIIFSTYVLEHVTNPAQHLDHVHDLLAKDGSLFIFCPRYDMPGYRCPSSRHLSWFKCLNFEVQRSIARFRSLLSNRPAFLIQTDVAAFHGPFFLDADAVHWVSLLDLKLWARKKDSRIHKLMIGHSRPGSKDWIVKRLLTCAVEVRK